MDPFQRAERLKRLPPYLFKEIDRKKQEVTARGVDIIDLGVGDPDLSTPDHIIEVLKEAVGDPANHRYPSYSGMNDFKYAVAEWYQRRFGVVLDPETEVLSLIGSKEGIAHLPLAFINPGEAPQFFNSFVPAADFFVSLQKPSHFFQIFHTFSTFSPQFFNSRFLPVPAFYSPSE